MFDLCLPLSIVHTEPFLYEMRFNTGPTRSKKSYHSNRLPML